MNPERSASNVRRISFDSLERTRLSPHHARALAAEAEHTVALAIGRATLVVRFSRSSAAAAFAERFADMPGAGPPDAVIFAVTDTDGAYFWQHVDCVHHWPEPLDDELLVFFADCVAMHEYLRTSADVGLHAAVIAKGPFAAALVGTSTAGKTTTAIAAARNGFALYSDERCVLQGGQVVPFLRALTLRAGGRAALLAEAQATTLDAGLRALPADGDRTIRPRALLGAAAGGPPRRLDAVFLIVSRAARPRIEARPLRAELPELLRSMVCRQMGIDRAVYALTAFRNVAIFRLWLGTPHATAIAIERTLNETVPGAHG